MTTNPLLISHLYDRMAEGSSPSSSGNTSTADIGVRPRSQRVRNPPPPRAAGDRAFVLEIARCYADRVTASDAVARLGSAGAAVGSWESVQWLLARHRCAAVAYRVLSDAAVRDACKIPETSFESLRSAYVGSFHRVSLEPSILFRAMEVLQASGVEALAIKGLVLGSWLYDDPALREHEDLDLLVPESKARTAEKALAELGYRPYRPTDGLPRISPRESQGSTAYVAKEGMPPIDLSFDPLRLFWTPAAAEVEWFTGWWDRRVEVKVAGKSLPTQGVDDQFIFLARHLQFHDFFRLNWYIDLMMLLNRYQTSLDWDFIGRMARLHAIEGGLYRTLELVDHAFGPRTPGAAWRALRPNVAVRVLHRRVWSDRLTIPRDDPSHGGSPIVPRYLGIHGSHPVAALALLTLHRDRWANAGYLVRRFLPTREWLRTAYSHQMPPKSSWLALMRQHWRQLRRIKRGVRRGQ